MHMEDQLHPDGSVSCLQKKTADPSGFLIREVPPSGSRERVGLKKKTGRIKIQPVESRYFEKPAQICKLVLYGRMTRL